jgi:hypothetical protein
MKVYVAWSVDHMEGLTAAALMSDNVEELRRISGDLRRASENIKAWGIAAGGAPVLDLNVIGVMAVPPDKMTELPSIAQRFRDITEGTISIGVGMSLSEAYVAMKHSQSGGGDKIALYDPSMEEHNQQQPQPTDPLASLGKAESPAQPQPEDPKNQVAGYADNPSDFGLDENDIYADAENAEQETEKAPAPDSPAPAAPASSGGADAQQPQPQQGQGEQPQADEEDPRTVVVQALEKIKAQAQVLEQMKQTNPQAFDAVKSVVAAMILMAQGMAAEADDGEDEVNKSEPSDLVQYLENDGHEHEWGKDEAGGYCLKCGSDQQAVELAKAGLPMPKPTPKRIVHPWPVGTVKEGKVKVTHVDPNTNAQTGTGWKEGRAGMVMSPDGHPTSSRNPNGK